MFAGVWSVLTVTSVTAQPITPAGRQPGDDAIEAYLRTETEQIQTRFLEGVKTAVDWQTRRPKYQRQLLYMLGLWPVPEKTPLQATVVRTLEGDGFAVDMLHYQSVPGLYVTANLYRPVTESQKRLPAILYVCGHSSEGRNGNKTAYQDHGIWFARHGYICLILDTLQRGEIKGTHWGTYVKQRWDWHSRGYTPAGVECWNGVRGIDYLIGRDDVDPERIAVTGISGGGMTTFWIAGVDERVRVAVPVSGFADVEAYVNGRILDRHCDCMSFHNALRWPFQRIAALVAPRPLLFVNSDNDAIFPMDSNQRTSNSLERLYSLFGAGDQVETVVSIGGHAYRKDIRQAVYRFLNIHLQNDPRPVTDSEVDLVVRVGRKSTHPISPEQLRVFPTDSDIPRDERNTTIDEHFVPRGHAKRPNAVSFASWKRSLVAELGRVSFNGYEERLGRRAQQLGPRAPVEIQALNSASNAQRVILLVANDGDEDTEMRVTLQRFQQPRDSVHAFYPSGTGPKRWTQRNPANYVERSLALLGHTADTVRVEDVITVARRLQQEADVPVWLAGVGNAGILAVYATLLDEEHIAGAIVLNPPDSHVDSHAPQFLNALRVCDIPEVIGMIAPRPLHLIGATPKLRSHVQSSYGAAGALENLQAHDS